MEKEEKKKEGGERKEGEEEGRKEGEKEKEEREKERKERKREENKKKKNPTNPTQASNPMPQPNPRKHRLTCNLNDGELTRFRANRTRAGHHSDSAYLRDQALRANPTRALDKDWERLFLQGHVELAGAIDRGDYAGALTLSKELIARIVK